MFKDIRIIGAQSNKIATTGQSSALYSMNPAQSNILITAAQNPSGLIIRTLVWLYRQNAIWGVLYVGGKAVWAPDGTSSLISTSLPHAIMVPDGQEVAVATYYGNRVEITWDQM